MTDPVVQDLHTLKTLCAAKFRDDSIIQGISRIIQKIKDREQYCLSISSPTSEALNGIYSETLAHPFEAAFNEGKTKWNLEPVMMTGPLEGNFLQSIVSISNAKRVLEIGTYTGYAALACAEVLPEDGQLITCEFDPYLEDMIKTLLSKSPHGRKIELRIAPAMDTLEELARQKKPFDVIFIDANKDGYIDYYKNIMRNNLLAKGGTILFDNALMEGMPYARDPKNMDQMGRDIKACNEFLKSQPDIHRTLVPIRDGVLIVRRKSDMYGAQ